jgi:hypothetical protein
MVIGPRAPVDRIIHEMAEEHGRPVIKWTENHEGAFRQPEPEFGE